MSFTSTFPDTLSPDGVYIQVLCYQNASIVYAANGYYNQQFHLGGSSHRGCSTAEPLTAAPTCTYWGRNRNIMATTEFDAQG